MVSEKKQRFKDVKETAGAYGTLSEEEAIKKAKDVQEITKELIEKDEIIKEIDLIEEPPKKEIEEEQKKIGGTFRPGGTWMPKTKLGKEVKERKIMNLDEILESKRKILEPEIIDWLLTVKSDLISVGQSKGKFGGGKRRACRQTQRKTAEGNIPTFSTMAVVGDESGHVGIGSGEAKEPLPARDKAIRKAKLNI